MVEEEEEEEIFASEDVDVEVVCSLVDETSCKEMEGVIVGSDPGFSLASALQ